MRVLETAFPEALSRVVPFLLRPPQDGEPILRWVTGLPVPVAYRLEGESGLVLLGADALQGLKTSRNALHETALEHVRRRLPPGFAPGRAPAYLDDGVPALLLLPELVPDGESWLAIAQPDGALVVLREGTDRTERDLARLRAELEGGLFDAPVRVRRSGFEPAEWPTGGAR
ncbi:MAG TPA: hypothetical protein DEF51_46540 [Myxococcales bacterium]|nr:hypothetical protein [Myxococcales bacterium]